MSPHLRSAVFTLLGLACGLTHTAAAQTRLEVTPYVGVYRPTNDLASERGVRLRQQQSVTLGVRVTKWWRGRAGFEGAVGYAASQLWDSNGVYRITLPASVVSVSAKALLRVTPPTARATILVGGGVGLVSHGGDLAYPQWYVGPRTFFGGVANADATLRLARWVAVRFDVEDFVYSAHVGPCTRSQGGSVCDVADATGSTARLQDDVVFSLGFMLLFKS